MQTTELRRGNKLVFEGGKVPRVVTVKTIFPDSALVIDQGLDLLLQEEDLKGIMLTDDILKHLGFTERPGNMDHFIKISMANDILIIRPFRRASICAENSKAILLTPVLFVHELQNLYFFITGTELKADL
jgi:hypothetical protein